MIHIIAIGNFLALIAFTQLNKKYNFKIWSVLSYFSASIFIILLIYYVVTYLVIPFFIPIINDPNLLFSTIAILISVLSLLYSRILFNNKVSLNTNKEVRNDKEVCFLEIQNNSNKNIEILSITVNGVELNHNDSTLIDGVNTYATEVGNLTFNMFYYKDNFKLNIGSSLKIQYTSKKTIDLFVKKSVKIQIQYKTLKRNCTKFIETDLGVYV